MFEILRFAARPRPGAAIRALHFLVAAALAVAALCVGGPLRAHDVPAAVTALVFVRPEGRTLHVVVRVPLGAMRDVEFPLRPGAQGYLDVARAGPQLREAAQLWVADHLTLYEEGARLAAPRLGAVRAALPSDGAFADFGTALAAVREEPLPAAVELPWQQAMLDVALEYPIRRDDARFSVRPALAHLGVQTTTVLRFLPPAGAERAFRLAGDAGLVRLDPRWHQAAATFVAQGFGHILDGVDHLLFVLCLVIPLRRLRALAGVVTAFTAAHSITLAASALGLAPDALWFAPLVEVLVALSIVYMACENVIGPRLERRWMVAFGFGLVHGFAFSSALRDTMQFAGAHLATALLAFNVGVELGQLLVVALAVPALAWLFRRALPERLGTILLSAIVAHTAWHWLLERGAELGQYRLAVPTLDRTFLDGAARATALAAVIAAALWAASAVADRMARGGASRVATKG
jgi:hypothetical protein